MADRAEGLSDDDVAKVDDGQTAAAADDTETLRVLEDDGLIEKEREARDKIYADRGKAKIEEISSESDDPKESAVLSDDDNYEGKNIDKATLEDLDFDLAMRLQTEEYERGAAMLQPPGYEPNVMEDVNTDDEFIVRDYDVLAEDSEQDALTMDAAAWRRYLPPSSICMSRFLLEDEVIPMINRLELTIEEAAALGCCPEILNGTPHSPIHKNLVVYDTKDNRYVMLLTSFHHYTVDRSPLDTEYFIETDWDRFVRLNVIKAGDMINVYKKTDPRVHPDPFFVIKVSRGLGRFPSSVSSSVDKKPSGKEDDSLPGSSKTSQPERG